MRESLLKNLKTNAYRIDLNWCEMPFGESNYYKLTRFQTKYDTLSIANDLMHSSDFAINKYDYPEHE